MFERILNEMILILERIDEKIENQIDLDEAPRESCKKVQEICVTMIWDIDR